MYGALRQRAPCAGVISWTLVRTCWREVDDFHHVDDVRRVQFASATVGGRVRMSSAG
jgi:hypothetical protein